MRLSILKRNNGNVVGDHAQEARNRVGLTAFLLALGAALLLWFYDHRMVSGLVSSNAMDYAQLGRNLLGGRGFATQILRPLALTDGANPLAQPDLTHGPLYPFLIALAFGLAGAKDSVVLGLSGLFYVLTVPMLYFLGRRLFSPQVGLLAALVFMTNGAILDFASSGTPTTLFMFLGTCLCLALFCAATVSRRGGEDEMAKIVKMPFVLAGILTGLLYLADPLFVWIVPIAMIAVPHLLPWRHPKRQAAAACAFLLPLAVLVLPCMLRFGLLTGNPLFGLRGAEFWMDTRSYPGLIAYRLSAGEVGGDLDSVKGLLIKLLIGMANGLSSLQRMPAGWIMLFVMPGLFFGFTDPALTRTRTIMLACLIGVFVGDLLLTYDPAMVMVVFPGLLVYAFHYLSYLTRQAQLSRPSTIMASGLLGIALLSPLAATLAATRKPATVPQIAVAHSLSRQSRPDEVVFSDQPWIVAWYADRPSIWIPVKDAKITELRKQFVKARWLFLTEDARSLSPEWNMAFSGLLQWDRQFQYAQKNGKPLPQSLRIVKDQVPITAALDGFIVVPPEEIDTLSAVVAETPASASKFSREQGQTEQVVGQ